MEGKLRILSESKLTAIISFTCEGNICYGGYSQIGSTQTLHKHTLKRRFQQSSIKIKCSILVKPLKPCLKRCSMCFAYSGEIAQ